MRLEQHPASIQTFTTAFRTESRKATRKKPEKPLENPPEQSPDLPYKVKIRRIFKKYVIIFLISFLRQSYLGLLSPN